MKSKEPIRLGNRTTRSCVEAETFMILIIRKESVSSSRPSSTRTFHEKQFVSVQLKFN